MLRHPTETSGQDYLDVDGGMATTPTQVDSSRMFTRPWRGSHRQRE